jgi:heme oxygenase-like protein
MYSDARPPLPAARGPLSELVLDHLRRPPHPLPPCPPVEDDPLVGDDLHLALYVCYELHYRSFAGVDEGWEWNPGLLALRSHLESEFELGLLSEVGPPVPVADVEAELHGIVGSGSGPSLSAHLAERGTREQVEEFAVHRSAYQLKEADPHTWAVPRLAGGPKAALVEIQVDEYGGGVEQEMHASLFGDTMAALGLDPTYGAYLDFLPGTTLATVNLVSLFGLHRRWRGALIGHLAVFEMTSVEPMGRYSRALARLGLGPEARRFYDVHVEADVGHAVVAARRMAAGLAATEPALAADIVFGAHALIAVETRLTRHLLSSWSAGVSSLLQPLRVGSRPHTV